MPASKAVQKKGKNNRRPAKTKVKPQKPIPLSEEEILRLNREYLELAFSNEELNSLLVGIRCHYTYNQSYRGSAVQKHDYHMAVLAANKAIARIDHGVREIIIYLPPLQEMVLAHRSENYDAMRAFGPLQQEEALPEVFKAVKELSAKLESLPGEILSLYQMFWPFAQAVRETDKASMPRLKEMDMACTNELWNAINEDRRISRA